MSIDVFRNLKFGQKLAIVVAVQIVPVLAVLWLLGHAFSSEIEGGERQAASLGQARPAMQLGIALAERNVALLAHGRDGSTSSPWLDETARHARESIAQIDAERQQAGFVPASSIDWSSLRLDLGHELESTGGSEATLAQERSALERTIAMSIDSVDRSSTTLDGRPGGANLVRAVSVSIPAVIVAASDVTDALGRWRAGGVRSPRLHDELAMAHFRLENEVQRLARVLSAAGHEDPAIAREHLGRLEQAQVAFGSVDAAVLALLAPLPAGAKDVDPDALNQFCEGLFGALERLRSLHEPLVGSLAKMIDEQVAAQQRTALAIFAIVLLGVGIALVIATLMTRSLNRKLGSAVAAFSAIAAGKYQSEIAPDGRDEIDSVLRALAAMQDKLRADLGAERAHAAENLRIRQALESSSAAVLLANDEGRIVFMNRAATRLFTELEIELQRQRPGFPGAAQLVGAPLETLLQLLPDQGASVGDLGRDVSGLIELAQRKMFVHGYPVLTEARGRLGFVVEMQDRSAEWRVEQEIAGVIAGAIDGNLSTRLTLNDKSGFPLGLSRQVNGLLDVNQKVLGEIQRVFASLSRGGLTDRVTSQHGGEYAKLRVDANATVDKLVEIVQQIQLASDLVSAGAAQMARGNQNLSERTTEQAASLEQTAASIEQLTSTVRHNADNAAQAHQVASSTRVLAEKGGNVVGRAVIAMRDINESSQRVADIIGVIDEIAFQTNLLALNAAVEAARAGEQGRGFAVVATEVRNLAQRSAESAKEIKKLIQDSVVKVDGGTRLVDESGRTLEDIVTSVKRVTDLIAEISGASREQAAGVEEINKAVTQMDHATSQNAALVDEATAATQTLSDQARALTELVAFFSVGRPGRVAVRARGSADVGGGAGSASAAMAQASGANAPASAPTLAPVALSPVAVQRARSQSAAVAAAVGDDWDNF
jgi:methyl-accepting chemotaxis protein